MNVFVLCTGRCGSVTFIEACRHISNFSSAHESRSHLLGADRLNYPANHIEADNRLSWLLGRLDETYGGEAFYVHLTRNVRDTAASFAHRYDNGIIKAYRGTGIIMGLPETTDRMTVALDYCKTVNSNIEAFLKDKPKKMQFALEQASRDFPIFCNSIDAVVRMDAALSEFDIRHNASETYDAARAADQAAPARKRVPGLRSMLVRVYSIWGRSAVTETSEDKSSARRS
jgi:hypothetical protein